MTSKLVPSNPEEVMVIRKISDEVTTLSVPFARFGRIKVGGRGTLVRLRDGSVAVFSPVALTPKVKETVAQMGELRYIAAPDLEHHIFLGPWHQAYPNAKVIGMEGLPEKREKEKKDHVPFSTVFTAKSKLTQKIDPAFDAEFDYEFVNGHVNKELVFNHRPSGTFIEADLIFNLPATEQYSRAGPGNGAEDGLLTRIWTSLNNTRGDAYWQKMFIWWGTSNGNKKSFHESMGRINKWKFDKIVPCHGDVIEKDGKKVFQTVMQWHLEKAAEMSRKQS